MKLYTYPITTNPIKIDLLINHLGLAIDKTLVELHQAEHQNDSFKNINPNARVPVLINENFCLWESQAILQYLANVNSSPLWPQSAEQQATVLRWLNWSAADWDKSLGKLAHQQVHLPAWGFAGDPAFIDKLTPQCHKALLILNEQLAQSEYIAGDNLSIADFSLAGNVFCYQQLSINFDPFPHVCTWLNKLSRLPCWQKTHQVRDLYLAQLHAYTSK